MGFFVFSESGWGLPGVFDLAAPMVLVFILGLCAGGLNFYAKLDSTRASWVGQKWGPAVCGNGRPAAISSLQLVSCSVTLYP